MRIITRKVKQDLENRFKQLNPYKYSVCIQTELFLQCIPTELIYSVAVMVSPIVLMHPPTLIITLKYTDDLPQSC